MKSINSIFVYLIAFILIFIILNFLRPYWDRYWLEKHLETVAVFGTKHGLNETLDLLMTKMGEEGYEFEEDDFVINKDEKNSVSINLAYTDDIKIFGKSLKQLQLMAEVSAREVKSSY